MNDTTALARVTSTTLKVVNQLVGDFNISAIYLNQIRTKIGVVYGDPRTTPGGSAMEFYASTRIFTGRKLEKEKATGDVKAAIIGLQTVKNKLARPYQEVELRLAYEDEMARFDLTRGYLEELIEAGKVPKDKSGRVTWEGKTYFIGPLVEKLDAENKQDELRALLVTP
jgi:recombination protein RecA